MPSSVYLELGYRIGFTAYNPTLNKVNYTHPLIFGQYMAEGAST